MGNHNSGTGSNFESTNLQRQSEFEHWKKLGNDMAVSALMNSENITWFRLEQKLRKALEYYNKTPDFGLLYDGQTNQLINNYKNQNERIITLMTSQSYYGFNYPEEILRVSKNKAVCQRALIQNIYLQIQSKKSMNTYQDDLETASEVILQFIDNQNLSLKFIVDQLRINPKTGIIENDKDKGDYSPSYEFNGPGSGGSPTHPGSFQKSSFQDLDIRPSKLVQSNHEKRYIELLGASNFLFADKFLKNLLQPESDLTKKIYFLERIIFRLNPSNFDFLRKMSWILSKNYYKKSVKSQNTNNLQAAIREIQFSSEHFQKYLSYTQKIQNNRILRNSNFLINHQFLSQKQLESHKIRIENHLQILLYQNDSHKIGLRLKSPKKHKMIINMKQMANNIDSSPKKSLQKAASCGTGAFFCTQPILKQNEEFKLKNESSVISPTKVHPPKIKLPAKVQAHDSPQVSDEEQEEEEKSPSPVFSVNIEVKSPPNSARVLGGASTERSKSRLDKLLKMAPNSYQQKLIQERIKNRLEKQEAEKLLQQKHAIEQGRTASPIFNGTLESPRSNSSRRGEVTSRKKSPRVAISNVDDPVDIKKLKKFLQKSIENDNKRLWKKYKNAGQVTDRMKSPPPLSKTGLMVAPTVPIKRPIKTVKSPRPPMAKKITPRVNSARSNKSSQEFRVFAKNVYETQEVLKEKNKLSMAENSSRAGSRKVTRASAAAPIRKKYEGLKILQPQPAKSTERVRKSVDKKFSAKISKKASKNEIVTTVIASNDNGIINIVNNPSENTVWIDSCSIPKEAKKPSDFLPLRKLGRGSFGDVYLVKELSSGRLFAMKTLCKRRTEDSSWLRYVITERDVLASSHCPFIVNLHCAFQTEKKLFLVIDFCPGGDLETMLSTTREPFSEEKARFYIAEIIIAIKDLHSRDIIYRDLKPDNVVIDDQGHAQLIDFGMAKSNIPDVQKGAKTFCGSVKYLAPEMVRKIGHGQALDWYLLGVLLYEMLVGVTPYFSTNKDELFDNIINGKLKLPRNISEEVKNLIICLLNRNPQKRLGSKPGDQGAEMIMAHPFFASINWEDLVCKRQTGSYVPEKPRYSMQDYVDVVTQTEFSQKQLEEIWNGEEIDAESEQAGEYKQLSGWEFAREEEQINIEKLQVFITPEKQDNRIDQVSDQSMASPKEIA